MAEIVHDYNYAQVLTLDLLHKGMRLTEGYGSVGSYVAGPFSDFEPTLYDPPLGLGTVADLRDADFVIVCVPTPQLPSGPCDTSIVEEVVGLADPRVAIVCHSTIAIGTTERLIAETSKPLVFVPGYAGEADDHPLRDPWSRRFLIYGGYDPAASAVQALYERAYEVAARVGADLVVRHERNRGLGAALRTGLEAARGLDARAAVYLDADLEYDPAEIPALLAPIEAGEADYVLGSRFLGRREGHSTWRSAGNRVFTLALSFASGRRISDAQTGFRAFPARALNVAEIVHDYNYAQVLTLDLLHKGMRLTEVPISYRSRTRGRSFINGHYLWRVPLGMARELLGSQP